jgi:hypothetical protein
MFDGSCGAAPDCGCGDRGVLRFPSHLPRRPGDQDVGADPAVIRSGLQVGGQAVLLGGTRDAFLHRLVLVGLLSRRFRSQWEVRRDQSGDSVDGAPADCHPRGAALTFGLAYSVFVVFQAFE